MSEELKEQYEQELSEQFDWEALKRDCLQSAVEVLHSHTLDELRLFDLTDEEAIVGQAYLGTVFALTPSGKYYMPFACSNVVSCPECGGDGHARELCQVCYTNNPNNGVDCENCHEVRSARESIMEKCQYCDGMGARGIKALAELRSASVQVTVKFLRDNDYEFVGLYAYKCNACHGTGKQFVTCPTCNGIGSAEAYQDQVWYEALESVCDEYNMWYTAGEGDPCNVMVRCWVSFAEITRYVLDQHVELVQAWLDGRATIREVKEGLRVAKSLVSKVVQLEKGE